MRNIIIILAALVLTPFYSISQGTNKRDANGMKEGPYVKSYENGKKKYQGQFKNDKPYGTFTYYFNTGDTSAIVEYSDNGIIANTTTYYKSGNIMAEGVYLNKKKEGNWKYFIDEDKNPIISSETYKDGTLEGESITYYPDNGQPAEVIVYSNDKKNGKLFKYFQDGILMTESYYVDGKPHGAFLHYHPDGELQIRGNYHYGVQSDNWDYYDENGKRVSEEEFLKQDKVSEIK